MQWKLNLIRSPQWISLEDYCRPLLLPHVQSYRKPSTKRLVTRQKYCFKSASVQYPPGWNCDNFLLLERLPFSFRLDPASITITIVLCSPSRIHQPSLCFLPLCLQRKEYVKYAKVFPLSGTLDFKVPSKWYRRVVGSLEIICGLAMAIVPSRKKTFFFLFSLIKLLTL